MIRVPTTLDTICNAANTASPAGADLGAMPEWDLTDLFPSTDGPELTAAIEKAVVEARAFEQAYKGKLVANGADGAFLGKAVRAYEAASDALGRIGTFAFLNYAGSARSEARQTVW